MTQLTYPGYMSQEAQSFFEGYLLTEQRDGCAATGFFVRLANGSTVMPSKGDVFIKDNKGITKQNINL